VRPVLLESYETGTFPKFVATRMGELGFLGAQLTGYGCAGLDYSTYGLLMKEIERGDSGLRSFASVQGGLVMYPIWEFGSEKQKQKWLPGLARGTLIGCFGLTEPDFGSNPAGMRTTAKKVGNSYVLNGSKTWITNSPIADVCIVWAKVVGDSALPEGSIRAFMVEKGTPGFSAPEIKAKLSLRASITGELLFADCKIPAENVLEKTTGLKHAFMCLNVARFGIAWGVLGAAEDCLEEALSYAQNREMHGKPLASYQLVQAKLARMSTQLSTAFLVAGRLGELKNNGKLLPQQISMAKQNNVEIALNIARTCRDILGANGVSLEYRSMRHSCNLESVYTYEGTNDVHLLVVGQALTGLNAFGN
jgi:glutaryl-CoA dehydrogenase